MSADNDRLDALERTVGSLYGEVKTLKRRVAAAERQLMAHDEELDTGFRTSLPKKILFVVDGWPLHRVVERPAWRPWRRWWTS